MHIKVNKWGFISAICNDKHSSMPAQAAGHLFEYLEDWDVYLGEEASRELDVVAIRCSWNFFECADDFVRDFGNEYGTTRAEIHEQFPFTFIVCDGESFISEVF